MSEPLLKDDINLSRITSFLYVYCEKTSTYQQNRNYQNLEVSGIFF